MTKKYKTVTITFDDHELASGFLAYMSDGGGEQGFVDQDTGEMACDWDYHGLNDGEFGPKVKATRVKR